jgi:RNA polymerase sigma factor for flagellar operon FliA
MNPAETFESHLALIDRIVATVCRRARVYGADAEDFASNVKVALMENDFAILRRYEGRAPLAAFLAVVIQRLFIDQRTQALGRWHASRDAERIGEPAVLLEVLLSRDHRTLDEALPIVQRLDCTLTRAQLEEMAARLPRRTFRPRAVELDEEAAIPAHETADQRVIDAERERISHETSRVIRETLEDMSLEDAMILRFRFGSQMSIAGISRMLRIPQRPLYRRVEFLLDQLRKALTAAHLAPQDITELIGSATQEMDFGLTDRESDSMRPSLSMEGAAVEEPS